MTVDPAKRFIYPLFLFLMVVYPSSDPEKPGAGTGVFADDLIMWQILFGYILPVAFVQ